MADGETTGTQEGQGMITAERIAPGQAARIIRIALVEDHDLVREGLAALLERSPGLTVVAQASTLAQARQLIPANRPDIVLLDMKLGAEDGLDLIPALRAQGLQVPVVVLTAQDAVGDLRRAVAAGASGFLLKNGNPDELLGAVRATIAGESVVARSLVPRLIATVSGEETAPDPSPRERQVLDLLVDGATNGEIAEQLGLSIRTAQKHVENLFRKFGVGERQSLVREAFRHGFAN